MSRLFPFGRGIIHDYPASNFWILFVDYKRYFVGVSGFGQLGTRSDYDEKADLQYYKKMSIGLTVLFLIVSAQS